MRWHHSNIAFFTLLTYSVKMPNELVNDFQLAHIPTFSLSFE